MLHILSNRDRYEYLAEGFSLGEKLSEHHFCRCGATEKGQPCDCPGYDHTEIVVRAVIRDCDNETVGSVEIHDGGGQLSEPSLGRVSGRVPVWTVSRVDSHTAELWCEGKKLAEVSESFFFKFEETPEECGTIIDGPTRGPGQPPTSELWFVGDEPAMSDYSSYRRFASESEARAYAAHLVVVHAELYGVDVDPVEPFTTKYRAVDVTVQGCRQSSIIIDRL